MRLIYRSLYIVVDICTRSYNHTEFYVFPHTLGSYWMVGSSKGYLLGLQTALRRAQTQLFFFLHHPLFHLFPARFRKISSRRSYTSIIVLRLLTWQWKNLSSRNRLGRVGECADPPPPPVPILRLPPKWLPVAAPGVWMDARGNGEGVRAVFRSVPSLTEFL